MGFESSKPERGEPKMEVSPEYLGRLADQLIRHAKDVKLMLEKAQRDSLPVSPNDAENALNKANNAVVEVKSALFEQGVLITEAEIQELRKAEKGDE